MLALLALLACGSPEPGDPPASEPEVDAPDCPFEGRPGAEVGDTVEDLRFVDCEGASVSLHDLCGFEAMLVSNFYGTCSSCFAHADIADEYAEYPHVQTVQVLTEDVYRETPKTGFCRGFSGERHPDVLVVVDEDRVLDDTYGEAGLSLVVDRDGVIVFKRVEATESVLREALDALLP